MSSPNFDNLHLKLSRKIFDPVAAAATDGVKVSSDLRTDYLNRANRFIENQVILLDKSLGLAAQCLPGLLKTQSFTWTSAGTSLSSDYVQWLSSEHVSGTTHTKLLFRDPSRKVELDSSYNPFDKNVFTILGGKIYGYLNGSILTSGSGVLYYLASDQRASSGDTSDIAIDEMWWDLIVDLAASFFNSDTGNLDKGNAERVSMVMSVLGK